MAGSKPSDWLAVNEAVVDLLRTVPGFDQVVWPPPGKLPDETNLLAYVMPRVSDIDTHGGGGRGMTTMEQGDVIIELHIKSKTATAWEEHYPAMLTHHANILAAVRWFQQASKTRGTILGMNAIRTERFGAMGWGDDASVGFRLSVECQFTQAVPLPDNTDG